jgi:hypothetical protein
LVGYICCHCINWNIECNCFEVIRKNERDKGFVMSLGFLALIAVALAFLGLMVLATIKLSEA